MIRQRPRTPPGLQTPLGSQVTGKPEIPGRVDLCTIQADKPTALRLSGAPPCTGISVAVAEDSPAPRVYSPANLCFDITLANLEPGNRYVIIVCTTKAGPRTRRSG